LLDIVNNMAQYAPDFEGSVVELISMLHRLAVAQAVPNAIDNSWGDAERVEKLAKSIAAEDVQLYYQVAVNGRRDMAFAADPRSGFEMILLRMIAFRPTSVLDESLSPGDIQPAQPDGDQSVAVGVDPAVKKPVEAPVTPTLRSPEPPPREPIPPQESVSEAGPEVSVENPGAFQLGQLNPGNWPALLEQLGLHGIVYNIASHCELRSCEGPVLEFILDANNASLFNDKHRSRISMVLENYFNTSLSVSVECGEPHGETPAMQKLRLAEERQREAVEAIDNDPLLRQLIERFDGKLDRSSIAPLETGNPDQ